MNEGVRYVVGMPVQVVNRVIQKDHFPTQFRQGVVVHVETTQMGNVCLQQMKVHHANGTWGWIDTEVEPLKELPQGQCVIFPNKSCLGMVNEKCPLGCKRLQEVPRR